MIKALPPARRIQTDAKVEKKWKRKTFSELLQSSLLVVANWPTIYRHPHTHTHTHTKSSQNVAAGSTCPPSVLSLRFHFRIVASDTRAANRKQKPTTTKFWSVAGKRDNAMVKPFLVHPHTCTLVHIKNTKTSTLSVSVFLSFSFSFSFILIAYCSFLVPLARSRFSLSSACLLFFFTPTSLCISVEPQQHRHHLHPFIHNTIDFSEINHRHDISLLVPQPRLAGWRVSLPRRNCGFLSFSTFFLFPRISLLVFLCVCFFSFPPSSS